MSQAIFTEVIRDAYLLVSEHFYHLDLQLAPQDNSSISLCGLIHLELEILKDEWVRKPREPRWKAVTGGILPWKREEA